MLLKRRLFFIRERVAMVKLTDTYDILDPETQAQIGLIREEPGLWVRILRVLTRKGSLPTVVNVYETEGQPPLFSIRRGFKFVRAKFEVFDAGGASLGCLKSKLLTIGGGLTLYDTAGQKTADVKGDWLGWDFKFLDASGNVLGLITKKWGGIGRELFTSADNYMVQVSDAVAQDPKLSIRLLAAAVALDMTFKERE
jgi:uncharacterized protein YxjI